MWVANAELLVKVAPPKTTGSKVVVKLDLKNTFDEEIESAKAAVFLLDEHGKMVGQATRWVIGGTKDRAALESKGETTFNFVITSSQPFATTNLTANVSFSRVILNGGKPANVIRDVSVTAQSQH